ncbi:helix-turn-helix domain-containing protein [Gracilibacillus salitolerans]|uniref:Helix-turn-helix domain-containing protein n=1 Tax=Gracilibacillus salitolerans TaxID=2663022 RepID=A0A5Q2TPB7_9BACI|nr:helix-turn-helix domain-containing protein [Gracilibacillus salitolerans]QGH36636.1 helix-turn-helix domain-containing protein [Gracilibacillus salitolerans]
MIKSKLFIKYIFSYLFVFLVPFIVMSSIIYTNSVSDLKEEIEQSNLSKLEQVATLTNERVSELETIANRIAYDPRLTPYMLKHEYYGSEAIDELKKYKANSSIIEEILIYYHGNDLIYSSEGSYTVPSLIRKYQFYNWDNAHLVENLQTNIPINTVVDQLSPQERNNHYITYFFPLTLDNNNSYGTVVYLIKDRTINELIANTMSDFKGNAYIISEHNQVIASTIKDENIDSKSIDIENNSYGEVNTVELNGNEYSLAIVESDITGWKFIIMMETDQFFERLSNTIMIMIILCLSLFIVGSILAIAFAKKQYQPIRSLFDSVSNNRKLELKGINELDTIKRTVTSVFEDHEMLSETIFKHQTFAKDQFLTNIIKGDFTTEEEINSYNETLYLDIHGDYYCSMIISLEKQQLSKEKITERETIYELFTNITLEDVTAYGIDLLYMDAIALVVKINGDRSVAQTKRNEFVKQLKWDIKEITGIKPMIGIGKVYDKTTMINRSYIEALAALEHKYFYSQGSCIYFENIKEEKEFDIGYPKEDLLRIVQSIKQGDSQVAKEALLSVFDNLQQNELSLSFLKAICFDIINTVMKTITEIGVNPSKQKCEQIFDFQTIEQLFEKLNDLVFYACKEVNENKKSHNEQLKYDIIEYLHKHFDLYDLSLEKIAIEFRLSASYVSRFIKEQTGYTFKQYVQYLRMEEVKTQLVETNKPIKAIVLDVGYKDVANFTRKFKNEIGITPGKYRQIYTETANN